MRVPTDLHIPKYLELREYTDKQLGVVAAKPISAGEVVCEIYLGGFRHRRAATGKSIQIWENVFWDAQLNTIDDYFNHSCNPTTRINFSCGTFEALRNIKKGEEITWNYLTTEYDLVQDTDTEDFDCKCGSEACVGRVKGFRYLTEEQKQRLLPNLSTYLRTTHLGIKLNYITPEGTLTPSFSQK